jgi:hypothetical protein
MKFLLATLSATSLAMFSHSTLCILRNVADYLGVFLAVPSSLFLAALLANIVLRWFGMDIEYFTSNEDVFLSFSFPMCLVSIKLMQFGTYLKSQSAPNGSGLLYV